jgi:hypothetical protein
MAHPSTNYLKYLLVRGRYETAETAETINETLAAYSLPPITAEEFARLDNFLKVPKGLMLNNRDHGPTIEYMKGERILSIWAPKNGEADIFQLLQFARPRETIQVLLMGGLDFALVAEKASSRHRLNPQLNPRLVEMFYHYFWNVDIASAHDWSQVLWNFEGRPDYLAALKGGAEQALFRAGFNPEVGGIDSLRNAFSHMHFRLDATRCMPDNKDTAEIITKLSRELVSLYDTIFGGGEDMRQLLKEFRAMKLGHRDSGTKSIRDLAANGSFSGEVKGGSGESTGK